MNLVSAFAVAGGAAIGALLRWMLGLALNPLLPNLPLGTLIANLIGGLLMGIILGFADQFQDLPMPIRLAATTGFLGGLTTFSAFSGETAGLILREQWGWTTAIIIAHVVGSLLATLLGVSIIRAILRS
jgi:CrcB protein